MVSKEDRTEVARFELKDRAGPVEGQKEDVVEGRYSKEEGKNYV